MVTGSSTTGTCSNNVTKLSRGAAVRSYFTANTISTKSGDSDQVTTTNNVIKRTFTKGVGVAVGGYLTLAATNIGTLKGASSGRTNQVIKSSPPAGGIALLSGCTDAVVRLAVKSGALTIPASGVNDSGTGNTSACLSSITTRVTT